MDVFAKYLGEKVRTGGGVAARLAQAAAVAQQVAAARGPVQRQSAAPGQRSQPALLVGGGTPPPILWDVPQYAPPLQGPPAPRTWIPPISPVPGRDIQGRNLTAAPWTPIQMPSPTTSDMIPMPTIPVAPMPDLTLPMGPNVVFEDGSVGPPSPRFPNAQDIWIETTRPEVINPQPLSFRGIPANAPSEFLRFIYSLLARD